MEDNFDLSLPQEDLTLQDFTDSSEDECHRWTGVAQAWVGPAVPYWSGELRMKGWGDDGVVWGEGREDFGRWRNNFYSIILIYNIIF